jgi:hypothetical protein
MRYQTVAAAQMIHTGVSVTPATSNAGREQHADREHDHRDADEVTHDVALVAVVRRVLHHQLVGIAHECSPVEF